MGLRDIVGSFGVVPRYLANKDRSPSCMESKIMMSEVLRF
jgi:hypothetical protein